MRLVFDLEANGLYDKQLVSPQEWVDGADTIWCIVTKDENKNILTFHGESLEVGIEFLAKADELIGHNIIDYDLRLIKKLYPDFSPKAKIFDTMILSQLLDPDRKGGHSLAQYGEEQGIPKPVHEDWSKFSPEMLHRCTQDVQINHKVYDYLIKEAYDDVEGVPYNEVFANSIS